MRPTIAVLFDYLDGDYQAALRAGVQEAARKHDANVLMLVGRPLNAPSPNEAAQNELYSRIRDARVDGVILAAGSLGAYTGVAGVLELYRRLPSVPCCSVSMQVPGIPSLIVDNWLGSRAIVDHFIEVHRRRRIAYIRGPEQSSEACERFEAYRASLRDHGIEPDPRWVALGDFWVERGASAMRQLLTVGEEFDAVIGANDHTALAALNVLRESGIRVPEDVLVAGFDDILSSLVASPSLTTARQPVWRLGQLAVETVMAQLGGSSVPLVRRVDVELVTRQSCGCAYHHSRLEGSAGGRPSVGELRVSADTDLARLERHRRLSTRITVSSEALGDWAEELLRALEEELGGSSGRFLLKFEAILERAQSLGALLDPFHDVLTELRAQYAPTHREVEFDELLHAAALLVGSAQGRSHAVERLRMERAHELLRRTIERLTVALGMAALSQALAELLPTLGIRSAAISLYADDRFETLEPLFVLDSPAKRPPGEPSSGRARTFASSLLAPPGFFGSESRCVHFVMPITFGTEQLGIAVLETGQHIAVYSTFREQLGAALKAGALHREMVQQTRARERAERHELDKELAIARKIQTGILPVSTSVEGLELAGVMVPAAEVGGDYYDVLPTAEGGWLAIGDVAGHGLVAGLVMLMVQSMIAVMVRSGLSPSPRTVLESVNLALRDNIRDRLGRDEHVTLVLMEYRRGGRLTYSGCHEEIVVWRKQTGRCELVSTHGLWLGILKALPQEMTDAELVLEKGDLLVLYTDGVTEAMNLDGEQFGTSRLTSLIERASALPVGEICRTIVAAVRSWAPVQADDISVLVGRYLGE
jgi:DNA-binding LacI/PurR family transcriptional regulator/serine phosphatase RsbU (regulator of sigma subunit)